MLTKQDCIQFDLFTTKQFALLYLGGEIKYGQGAIILDLIIDFVLPFLD